MSFLDDSTTMNAGGGWESIIVLANQALVSPIVAAAVIAGTIAVGEVVKEAGKDAYKAIKAAAKKCLRMAETKTISPQERLLGFRVYVLPLTSFGPDRLSIDISFKSSTGRGAPIRVSEKAVDEAFWLFENRLAPLLLRTNGMDSPWGRRIDLHIDPEGQINNCFMSIELDERIVIVHASREGIFLREGESQKFWLPLEGDPGLDVILASNAHRHTPKF